MKIILSLLFSVLLCAGLHAQDRILTVTGDEVYGKITVIDSDNITYNPKDTTQANNISAETKQLKIKDVFMVVYQNGTRDVFLYEPQNIVTTEIRDPKEMYNQGKADAKEYFNGTGAFIAGMCGVIPGAIAATTTPQIKPEKVSDINLIENTDYRKGYEEGAKHKKTVNAAAGFGTTTAVSLLVLIAAIISL